MIDYKQANPDHTMDQFNKALKELDLEIRKVMSPVLIFVYYAYKCIFVRADL